MPKHTLDNPSSPRANKRRHVSLARSTSTPRTPYTPSTFPSLFHTPRSGTPYPLHPLDSPSNPFGRKRSERLKHSLPPPTTFAKHLPLRFQLVRRGIPPRLGGVHRIVQVPLSYTFSHLRCLISFLFNGGRFDTEDEDHLFEVKKGIVMYSPLYKPGEIRKGTTLVKLSTVRDPARCKAWGGALDEEDELEEESTSKDPEQEEEEEKEESSDDEWYWADEEEWTLHNAWPKGMSTDRAIIYHHSNTAQIHITLNTSELPRRKGTSNVPYVFRARGRVRLTPIPLPKPIFSVPLEKLRSPGEKPSEHADEPRKPLSRTQSKLGLFLTKNPLERTTSKASLFGSSSTSKKRALPAASFSPAKRPRIESSSTSAGHDSEADAEGETDLEDENKENDDEENVEFGHSHPYFASLNRSSSPIKDEQDEQTNYNPPSSPCPTHPVSPLITIIDVDEGDEDEEEEEDEDNEDYSAVLSTDRWNANGVFEKYLERYTGPFISSAPASPVSSPSHMAQWDTDNEEDDGDDDDYDYDDDEKPHPKPKPAQPKTHSQETQKSSSRTPGLTQCSSIPSSPAVSSPQRMPPPPPPTSSPIPTSMPMSECPSSPYNPLPYHFLSSHIFPKFTPAPPKANRERIKRVIKRIERWKKGEWACARDEPVEEEVDEICEGGGIVEMTPEELEEVACRMGKPPGQSLKEWGEATEELEV